MAAISARLSAWRPGAALAVALALLVAAASLSLARPGFSSDEEITAVVVRGIGGTGLPTLPSGMLYLRGLPYSYAAWLGGALFGHSLVVYRSVSLLFAGLAVLSMYLLVRRVASRRAAAIAAILLASSPLFITASVSARFYTAFVAAALCAAWLFLRQEGHAGRLPRGLHPGAIWFVAAVVLARLLHEYALVLMVLPLCQAACADRRDGRPHALRLFAACALALAAVQAGWMLVEGASAAAVAQVPVPFGLSVFAHAPLARPPLFVFALAGPQAVALIAGGIGLIALITRRTIGTSWPLIAACAACALLFQTGAALMVVAAWALARPARASQAVAAGAIVYAGGAGLWLAHTFLVTDAQMSLAHIVDMVLATAGYPWEAVAHVGRQMPFVALAAAGTVVALLARPRPDDRPLRALAVFGLASLAALGISALELKERYLLLIAPVVFIAAAAFADRAITWLSARTGTWHPVAVPAATAAMLVLLAGGQYARAAHAPSTNLTWTSPDEIADVREEVVVCNDEMACQAFVGRVDYWLLQSSIADDYVVGPERRSVYTGARVVSDARMLDEVICGAARGVALVFFDSDKFGSDVSRQTMLDAAGRHGGTIAPAGGNHLVVRISHDATRCEGDGT